MDIVQEFSNWHVARGYLAATTAEAYCNDLHIFERWLCRHRVGARWSVVTTSDIEDFVAFLVDDDYEYSSVCRILSALSTFYRWCVKNKGLTKNPVTQVRRPRPTYHQREALSMDVIRQVLSQDGLKASTRAIIALISESGLRIGECLALRREDISLEYCQVKVMGKGRQVRICFFGPVAAEYLQEYFRVCPNLDLVFPESRRQYNWDIWHACHPFAGEVKCSPHILRHTFATECLSNGMPMDVLMLTLGHKSIDTTMLYTHCQSSRSSKFNHMNGARL